MNTARRLTGLSRRRRRSWSRDQIQVTDPEVMRRSIKGASIGNFMEWYDFGVYGYIATTIAQVFYPGDSVSAVHLIATLSTLAAAFVVRPVGGFIFGPLGDRIRAQAGVGDHDRADDDRYDRDGFVRHRQPHGAGVDVDGRGIGGAVTLVLTPEVAGRRLPGSPPSVETEQEARELVQGCD
jgi:MFS family permease